LDQVDCSGTERHISECSHAAWGFHRCTHDEDVAVSCVGNLTTTTRPTSTQSRPTSSSTQSGSTNDVPYTAQIVTAVVVVLGLLLIICVGLIIIGLVLYFCRKPRRRQRTEAGTVPMHEASSTSGRNNDAFDEAVSYEHPAKDGQTPDKNTYRKFQHQRSPHVAGAVGGGGAIDYEDMYEPV